MGKAKKPKPQKTRFKPFTKEAKPKASKKAPQTQAPTIPFEPGHRILLVGEGKAPHTRPEHPTHD